MIYHRKTKGLLVQLQCILLVELMEPLLARKPDDNFDKRNEYGITVVSLDEKFHQQYDPFSAPPRIRIDELEKRHDAGLKTWVSLDTEA